MVAAIFVKTSPHGGAATSARRATASNAVFAPTVVVALAVSLALIPASAALARPAHPSSHISPPQPIDSLSITGQLRDGGVVQAAGLSWRPGGLPRRDRLLTFEVAYRWRSCSSGRCRRAADSTVTPFAARRYVVGHADVGRRLRVTETATEVVETNAATFSFSVIRVSRSFTTTLRVRAFQRGTKPFTEFVDGLPDPVTGSAEEIFQIDPPHYAATDGPVHTTWRLDEGRWRTIRSAVAARAGTPRTWTAPGTRCAGTGRSAG